MKCNRCRNYQPCPSGVDDGYYRACREYDMTLSLTNQLSNEYKQEVMDEKRTYCKGFERF